jgi:5-methyltetrahydrofolate--homocysteine methyltransferase
MSEKEIYNLVLEFKPDKVTELVKDNLSSGVDMNDIENTGLIAAMDEVGGRFGSGELFIPEMLGAAINSCKCEK